VAVASAKVESATQTAGEVVHTEALKIDAGDEVTAGDAVDAAREVWAAAAEIVETTEIGDANSDEAEICEAGSTGKCSGLSNMPQ
jgi:hypothetical protein